MTKSMVNNYVKVGMIPRPTGKKYDRDHLAMLIMIGVLKQALSMESTAGCWRSSAGTAYRKAMTDSG